MDRELYSDRADVRQFIDEMVTNHGFDAARLNDLFAATPTLPKVIELIKPPADPGIRSWATYRRRFIEPVRIKAGKKFMARHAVELARAEARYGVPREIIAGVIGVETIYGKHTGNFGTFAALTTLAFDYPLRADLFRKELRELLLLARSEKRPVTYYRGSFAGALGLPQFLPSSIRSFAVDFDGDGRIDLQGSAADAIGSVANYLASHGWERHQPVAATVSISGEALSATIAEGIEPKQTVAELEAKGLTLQKVGADGMESLSGTALEPVRALPAAVIDLVTPNAATEYRLGFRNFYAITRYNHSTFYASAVMDLAQALK